MDGSRFDDLIRRSAGYSRRHVVKSLTGAIIGGLVGAGTRDAAAKNCREAGRTCSKPAHCCSGVCNEDAVTGRRRCACPQGTKECRGQCLPAGSCCDDAECAALGGACTAGVCDPASGQCRIVPVAAGRPCDDGDPCTVNDVCDGAGLCAGSPKDCSAAGDACNDGVCNQTTGACEKQPARNNAPCDDGNPCTTQSICLNGACAGIAVLDCSHLNTDCLFGQCVGGTCQAIPFNTNGACGDNPCYDGVCQSDGTCATTQKPNGSSCGSQGQHCCYGSCISRFEACPV